MSREAAAKFVHAPSGEDRREIEKTFGLDSAKATLLWKSVDRIIQEIQEHDAIVQTLSQGRDRKELIAYIRRLFKLLCQLDDHLADDDLNADRVIRHLLGQRLGWLLSHGAVANLTGVTPPHDPSVHSLDLLDQRPSSEIYPTLEAELIPGRCSITAQRAMKTLSGLVCALSDPLGRFLEEQRRARGGTPGRQYRNYVIRQLAPVYRQLWNQQPTTSPRGNFVLLCETVIDLIGLDSNGTDQAVARLLKDLKPV